MTSSTIARENPDALTVEQARTILENQGKRTRVLSVAGVDYLQVAVVQKSWVGILRETETYWEDVVLSTGYLSRMLGHRLSA